MAKTAYVENIKPNTNGFGAMFSVKEIQKHKARNGDPYFRVTLQDKTGSVQAKIWKDSFAVTKADQINSGDVLSIDFDASEYNGELQLTIKRAEKLEEYDMQELVKMSNKNVDEMYEKLLSILESVKDTEIRGVLLTIAKDPTIAKKLKYAIAAEKVHHDYIGGLVEHVLEMMAIAETILSLYPRANRSIVIAGIFLHDIGKIDELGLDQATFIRTLSGYLVGHITIGVMLFEKFLPPAFSEDKKLAIEHIILSHHRELEFGAVVKPATIEAIIVAMADLASSTVRQYQKELDEGNPDELGFGDFHKFQKIRVYHNQIEEKE